MPLGVTFKRCFCRGFRDFLVIALAGAFLTFIFQTLSSEKEEAQKVMDNTSTLIMKRMFELERVKWALESGNLNNAKILFNKYQDDSVSEWNIKYLIYANGIQRYFGKNIANKLKSPDDGLFYYFSKAHESIKRWMFCVENARLKKDYSFQNEEVVNCGKENCDICVLMGEEAGSDFKGLVCFGTAYIKNLDGEYQKWYQSFWRQFIRLF